MIRLPLLLIGICLALLQTSTANGQERAIHFIVKREYRARPSSERVNLVLDWKDVLIRLPSISNHGIAIINRNFGAAVEKKILDGNQDGVPDQVAIDFTFSSDEPSYSFSIEPTNSSLVVTPGQAQNDSRLQIVWLKSATEWKKINEVKNWPDKIIGSTLATYPDPAKLDLRSPGMWRFDYGFFLNATFQRWEETKNPEYYTYIKKWADRYLDSHGAIDARYYKVSDYNLEDVLPARILVSLYSVTGDEKYRSAAVRFKNQLMYQPRTADGGYWQQQIHQFQMWLDGSYMANVFSVQYAAAMQDPSFFNEAIRQLKLISERTLDAETGLMFHAWDESLNTVWAHPDFGNSPEFYSRGIAWYMMAIVDCLDYIPLENRERRDLGVLLQNLSKTVLRYQDKNTGLWFQVMTKGAESTNWTESSASAMIAYAFAKGHRRGILLDKIYLESAKKTFASLQENNIGFDDTGILYLDGIARASTLNVKTSKGDYDYYVARERCTNDYVGLGALLYLSMELD